MPEIYADWKLLKPLTVRVPAGTKCVVIDRREDDAFCLGEVVTVEDFDACPYCSNTDGVRDVMKVIELAILPAYYCAETKAEPAKAKRKIVQIAANGGVIVVLCNDDTMITFNGDQWRNLPPIPQD